MTFAFAVIATFYPSPTSSKGTMIVVTPQTNFRYGSFMMQQIYVRALLCILGQLTPQSK